MDTCNMHSELQRNMTVMFASSNRLLMMISELLKDVQDYERELVRIIALDHAQFGTRSLVTGRSTGLTKAHDAVMRVWIVLKYGVMPNLADGDGTIHFPACVGRPTAQKVHVFLAVILCMAAALPFELPPECVRAAATYASSILYGAQVHMDPARAARVALIFAGLRFDLDAVEPRPSPVHGTGVFARRRVRKGELITLYPAHVVWLPNPSGQYDVVTGDLATRIVRSRQMTPAQQHEFVKRCDTTLLPIEALDGALAGVKISGDPHIRDATACGHVLNDGARLESTSVMHLHTYNRKSLTMCNAVYVHFHGGCLTGMVATSDIPEGNECFFHYGPEFWIETPGATLSPKMFEESPSRPKRRV